MRPEEVTGTTIRVNTACGYMYLVLNVVEEKPFEIFSIMGKSGGCARASMEVTGRLITLGMQQGVPIEKILKNLQGIRCVNSNEDTPSCYHQVGKALERWLDQK